MQTEQNEKERNIRSHKAPSKAGRRKKQTHSFFENFLLILWAIVVIGLVSALIRHLRNPHSSIDELNGENPNIRNLPGYNVTLPNYVTQDYIPENEYSRPGKYLQKINGVVIHYVGNPGTSANANRSYFASLADGKENTYASSHFIVGLDGEVVQCVPLTEIAYASNNRNGDTISIEVCHPDTSGKFSEVTYARCIELTAWLCDTFKIDPKKDVIRHYDVTGKKCPLYYVDHPDAWEQFQADVKKAM